MKKQSLIIYCMICLVIFSCKKKDNNNEPILPTDPKVDFSLSRNTINAGDTIKIIKLCDSIYGTWVYDKTKFDYDMLDNSNYKEYICRVVMPGVIDISLTGSNTVTKQLTVKGGNWSHLSNISDVNFACLYNFGSDLFIMRNSLLISVPPILRSTDNGINWAELGNDLPYIQHNSTSYHSFYNMVFFNNAIYISLNYTSGSTNKRAIYKSDNSGISWQLVKDGTGGDLYVYNNKLFLTYSEYLMVSEDQGQTWNNIGDFIPGGFQGSGIIDGTFINNIFFAIWHGYPGNELWKNDGSSWSKITPIGIEGDLTNILSNNQNQLLALTDKGIYMSSDLGVNWIKKPIFGEPENYSIYEMSVNYKRLKYYDNNIIIAVCNYSYPCEKQPWNRELPAGGGLISIDNGQTWKCMGMLDFYDFVLQNDKVYGLGYSTENGTLKSCPVSGF